MTEPDVNRDIKLLLSAREAAKALSICEKSLWSATAPRGPIPCVRLGARVLYAVDDLERWIERAKGANRGQ